MQPCILFFKMATAMDVEVDFEENLDEILDFLDEDFFSTDDTCSSHLEDIVQEVETEIKSFKCDFCDKVCKSKQGLSRHVNAKHKEEKGESMLNKAEKKLHPGTFWKFSKDCAAKLAKDDCYSDETKEAFVGFSFTLDEAIISYKHIEKVVAEFTGNAEKFYPRFYDPVCTPSFFPRLSSKCCRILGCEVANHVLVHLNSLSSKPDGKSSESIKNVDSVEFSEKEQNVIAYMSGYVFHTVHKRLCKSKSMKSSELKEKYLALLEAGKKSSDVPRPYEALIEQKN